MPGPSSREHSSSRLWNLATSSFVNSTQEVSFGERSSTSSAVEDTAAQSAVSSPAILVWQRAAARIVANR
jgi:hypothetical protein